MDRQEKITVNGIIMGYCVFGEGNKNLCVLPGLSLDDVSPLLPALKDIYKVFIPEYRIYVFDRRENVPENYSISDMARDTHTVMKHLGIDRTDIIGVSQGGMIGMYLAILFGDFVKHLAIGSSSHYTSHDAREILKNWISLAKKGDIKGLTGNFLDTIHPESFIAPVRQSLIDGVREYSKSEINRFVICASSFINFDISEEIEEIMCPTLVLGCEGDKVFGAEPSREFAYITGCKLFIYGKEYGHAVYDEAPDYNKRIYDFFKERE